MKACVRAARPACLIAAALLSGCAGGSGFFGRDDARSPESAPASAPRARPGGMSEKLGGGQGVGTFDTSSAADRAAASSGAETGRVLGRTVASLGDPAEGGFWLRTGLVSAERPGRVVDPETGQGVTVELRPAGDASGGGRLSLAALRALDLPLTALPEVEVYAR